MWGFQLSSHGRIWILNLSCLKEKRNFFLSFDYLYVREFWQYLNFGLFERACVHFYLSKTETFSSFLWMYKICRIMLFMCIFNDFYFILFYFLLLLLLVRTAREYCTTLQYKEKKYKMMFRWWKLSLMGDYRMWG